MSSLNLRNGERSDIRRELLAFRRLLCVPLKGSRLAHPFEALPASPCPLTLSAESYRDFTHFAVSSPLLVPIFILLFLPDRGVLKDDA